MESQQNTDAVNFAKQKLEAQAKETQDKMGGSDNASVVSAQVVVPSDVGKKAEEVWMIVLECRISLSDRSHFHTVRIISGIGIFSHILWLLVGDCFPGISSQKIWIRLMYSAGRSVNRLCMPCVQVAGSCIND